MIICDVLISESSGVRSASVQISFSSSVMPDAPLEEPYPGAKKMLLVEDVDNKDFLKELVEAVYSSLINRRNKFE